VPIELAGSGDAVYEMAMQRLILPIARAYKPDFVLVRYGSCFLASDC
jgi:acetoin utilization deacetylase AcuC-like enzyme